MKVIGINGSARADGNTAILLRMVMAELEKRGIETELVQLAGKTIAPCKGCFACKGKGGCTAVKDDFPGIFESMKHADGILLGSPVYSADVSGSMKALLERAGVVAAVNPEILKHKVGGAVAAVRRGGGLTAVDTMNHFFLNKEMRIAGSTYWNMVYGKNPGDVRQDAEGVANMINLGKNMAELLNGTVFLRPGPEFKTLPAHTGFLAKKIDSLSGTFSDGAVAYLEPGGGGPVNPHTHPDHDHLFLVIAGEARIELESGNVILKANESFRVSGTVPHAVWNNARGRTVMLGMTLRRDQAVTPDDSQEAGQS